MRHFIVLGFAGPSKSEPGEQIHLGSDRGEAVAVTNTPDGKFARKEMFELALPQKSCYFKKVSNPEKKKKKA